jgi:hypothetical protein
MHIDNPTRTIAEMANQERTRPTVRQRFLPWSFLREFLPSDENKILAGLIGFLRVGVDFRAAFSTRAAG